MLDFRPPAIGDRELIESFTRDCGQIGSDIPFTNTYLWRNRYNTMVAFDGDTYYKCYAMGDNVTGYALPITRGDIRKAVDNIVADAHERGVKPFIGLLNNSNAELIHRLYEGKVSMREDRNSADYIYERANLAELSGKKYHAKRNHISRFIRDNSDYSFKEICEDNFRDVLHVAERWQENNDDTGELEIIKDALDHFDELGMFGLVLYVGGDPVAMCLASEINGCVCDVHFEKAVGTDGGYAVINNEFAKRFDKYTLINREEDMGIEGLRKSKLSYHPDILYTKSCAVFK